MRESGIGAEADEPETDNELQSHVDETDSDMTNLQFVGHQLEHMLAMCLAEVLMEHDAMADGQTTNHSIHEQENQIREVARSENLIS